MGKYIDANIIIRIFFEKAYFRIRRDQLKYYRSLNVIDILSY